MPQPGAHPRGQLLNIHQLATARDIPLPGEGGGNTFQSPPGKLWTGCEGTGLVTQCPWAAFGLVSRTVGAADSGLGTWFPTEPWGMVRGCRRHTASGGGVTERGSP